MPNIQCSTCVSDNVDGSCGRGYPSAKACLGGGLMYTLWEKKPNLEILNSCYSCSEVKVCDGICVKRVNNTITHSTPKTSQNGSDFVYKFDSGKTDMSLLEMIPNALRAFCDLSAFGEKKYKRGSFIDVPNARRRYTAAMWRHYFKEGCDTVPEFDSEEGGSSMAHDIHTMWNAIIRVECRLRGLPLGKDDEPRTDEEAKAEGRYF